MNTKMMIMDHLVKQKAVLEAQGYSVAYICVYGSQNYGLDIYTDEYTSDIDIKAIVVPTLDDLVDDCKPVSIVVETPYGQCDIKDIRLYFETLLKANPAYIETLFTDYHIVDEKFKNEFQIIFNKREELVSALKYPFIRAIYGMMCEKQKALCHPYPSIADKVEKYGYDGKQAHHALRLWILMLDYFSHNKPLAQCFHPNNNYYIDLMDLKLNKPDLAFAQNMVDKLIDAAKKFKAAIYVDFDENKIDYSVRNEFLQLSANIIKNKITEEIKRG